LCVKCISTHQKPSVYAASRGGITKGQFLWLNDSIKKRKELDTMIKLFVNLILLPFKMMIWVLKAVFWIPLFILGFIFDDGGPGSWYW